MSNRFKLFYLLLIAFIIALIFGKLEAQTYVSGPVPRTQVLTNVSAITTTGTLCFNTPTTTTTAYVVWGAGTSAGQVVIEEAYDCNYAGTWATLTTLNWTAASYNDAVHINGAVKAIRMRISTGIVGGTINGYFVSR